MSGIRKSTEVSSGRIPETLHIVCRKPRTETGYKGQLPPRTVRDAFVVSADSPNALETAIRWARQGTNPDPDIIRNVPNQPFPRLTLIDADERGEGGRALKAIITLGGTDGDILIDLREDVFYDLLFFKPQPLLRNEEGELRVLGPFQWGYLVNQMRLFWTGSELFRNLQAAATRQTLTKIGPDDLIPRHLYRTKQNKCGLFLGMLKITDAPKLYKGVQQAWADVNTYAYHNGPSDQERLLKGQAPERFSEHIRLSKASSYVEDLGEVPEAAWNTIKSNLWFPQDPEGTPIEHLDPPRRDFFGHLAEGSKYTAQPPFAPERLVWSKGGL